MHTRSENFYTATQQTALEKTAPLAGSHRVDVAIVGGGITGCSAALHLAERGLSVALLEAEHIGWGASGRSGGQILTGFGTGMQSMARWLGDDGARQAFEMSREAVDLTVSLIERHGIDCDLAEDAIYAALKPRHLSAYRKELDYMRSAYGYDQLDWLDREALYERVRSPAYLGGLIDHQSRHLHPLNYTLGLARAAQAAGAAIFEHSPARDIRHGKQAQVTTDHGHVTADYVLLAGNAYLGADVAPELAGQLMPVGNYIVATEPLTERQVAQTLPHNDAVSDANFVLDYFHLSGATTGAPRMLYGGQVTYGKRPPRRLIERMARKLGQLFPALEGIGIDYHWGGLVGVSRNRAPQIGRIQPNVFYAQGYSGHGMALAGLAGKMVGEVVSGQAERFDLYSRIVHRRFPGGQALRTPLLVMAANFYRLRDLL